MTIDGVSTQHEQAGAQPPAHRCTGQQCTSPNPNHHLYRNGRLWWLAATLSVGGRTQRVRRSLGTRDVALARRRRDTILAKLADKPGVTLALRFPRLRATNRAHGPRRAAA
jgi:hypothetical protein